jgi:hypothetical protein
LEGETRWFQSDHKKVQRTSIIKLFTAVIYGFS